MLLEQLLKFAIQEDENGEFPNDAALIQMTEEKVKEYIDRICPIEFRQSRRPHLQK